MSTREQVHAFLEKAKHDARIKPSHVSLYIALYSYWLLNDFSNPFYISREKIMAYAHIASTATYHKVLRDLCAFEYVTYEPSYDPRIRSKVCLSKLD